MCDVSPDDLMLTFERFDYKSGCLDVSLLRLVDRRPATPYQGILNAADYTYFDKDPSLWRSIFVNAFTAY